MAQQGRELIRRGNSTRYVRRDAKGRFQRDVGVGDSLGRDVRQPAQTEVSKGQDDRGYQRRD